MAVDVNISKLINLLQNLNQLYAVKNGSKVMIGETSITVDSTKVDYTSVVTQMKAVWATLLTEI